tara:strand:+ start:236 stop:427 length:192 start_codon:yes stop_codon:yes gene_type:complete
LETERERESNSRLTGLIGGGDDNLNVHTYKQKEEEKIKFFFLPCFLQQKRQTEKNQNNLTIFF